MQKTDDLMASGLPRDEATLEALRQHGAPRTIGYRLRKPFPWIDIRSCGTARGFIAIGPKAVGIFAFGGSACGIVAFGGFACGLISAGGLSLGLLFAFAGFGIGGVAYGGFTMGLVAVGGYVIGVVAEGWEAVGLWVPHAGHAISHYTSANVPPFLKSLSSLMEIPRILDRYPMVVWPAYGLGILAMSMAQMREGRRVKADEDWIIGGE
jgi:hypothetical protein